MTIRRATIRAALAVGFAALALSGCVYYPGQPGGYYYPQSAYGYGYYPAPVYGSVSIGGGGYWGGGYRGWGRGWR